MISNQKNPFKTNLISFFFSMKSAYILLLENKNNNYNKKFNPIQSLRETL